MTTSISNRNRFKPNTILSGTRSFVLAGAAALALSASAIPAQASDTIGDELQTILDKVVSQSGGKVSGALLRVSHPEKGDWLLASGTSDIPSGTPLTPDAHFRGGSLMKPLLAAVVMQLVEEGKLSLDATMQELLPADIAAAFDRNGEITLRMLLSHTGGIPEWMTGDIRMAFAADPLRRWSDEEIIASASAQKPTGLPGGAYSYSNTDYTLVAMIVESVTGKTWRDAIQTRVLDPLGLTDTLLPEPGDASMPDGALHGYINLGSGPVDITAADPSMAGAAGGSALVTTATDLSDFLDGLRKGELFSDPRTFDEMTAFMPAPGPGGQDGYGLGLTHFTFENGHELIGHTGGTAGYFSIVGYIPDLDLTVEVTQNEMTAYPDVVLAQVLAVMDAELVD